MRKRERVLVENKKKMKKEAELSLGFSNPCSA